MRFPVRHRSLVRHGLLALAILATACGPSGGDDDDAADDDAADDDAADDDAADDDAADDDAAPTDSDGDGYDASIDCNDASYAIHPGADEVCDGLDNDCDTEVDEDPVDGETFHADADADGYGDPAESVVACAAPAGTTPDGADCLDTDSTVHPGAAESCDGVDQDCDGTVDEDPVDADPWYPDADGDGHGDAAALPVVACDAPVDHVGDATDCDDGDGEVHPGAPESCDGTDQDCDGVPDDGFDDLDGDGWTACAGDCNDALATMNPGAEEVCDGVDNDCDARVDADPVDPSTWHRDGDGDGYGDPGDVAAGCGAPVGFVADGTDCNDAVATTHPGATDVCGNGTDDDCDGSVDESGDADGDGTSECAGDCDDGDPAIHPGATEACDGVDQDCDGAVDEPFDADGDGWATCSGDCDDADAAVYPGAVELCDGLDQDCDGAVDDGAPGGQTWYADADGDGYGDPATGAPACEAPPGTVGDGSDCTDTDPGVHPGASESCADGVDTDCDGAVDEGCGGLLVLDIGDADAAVIGAANSGAGYAVAGHDVDGDGCDELLVGESGYGDSGAVYLLRGGTFVDGVVGELAWVRFTGSSSTRPVGGAVGRAGDVDGDGREDVLLGSSSYQQFPGNYTGAAFLFLSSSL